MKDFFVECSSEDFMVCKSTKYAIMSPANWIAGEVGNYVAIGRGVLEGVGGGEGFLVVGMCHPTLQIPTLF